MVQIKRQTDKQVAKLRHETAVYEDYCKYNRDGQSKTELVKFLMAKHEIKAKATVYAIIKRVERRNNA